MATVVRQPAVAGRFYPDNAKVLAREIDSYTQATEAKVKALGCVVPHAGYMYSGHVAGAVYGRLELPRRFVILCPNHTGRGEPLAIMSQGSWATPLGTVALDHELAVALKRRFPPLSEDDEAHRGEHALEVQIPFLQRAVEHFTFVPIAVGVGNFPVLGALGEAIGDVLKEERDLVLIVASSDMNHYESDAITRVKDHKAIEPILALEPRQLYDTVMRENISMCGFGPTVAMLTAARILGATSATLVKYATSGDVSGDRDWVVGYAGVIVH